MTKVRVTETKKAYEKLLVAQKAIEEALELIEDAFDGGTPAKKTEKPTEPLHTPFKEVFMEWYKKEKGMDYVWSGADARNLNLVIGKLRSLVRTAPDKPTDIDKVATNSWPIMLAKIKATDNWLYENISIALLNSKFNNIVAKMMNPKANDKELNDYKAELEKRLSHGT